MTKQDFEHGRTTMGERGQIVIPQNIRTALKLKHGDPLVVIAKCGKIIVLPAKNLEAFFESVMQQMNTLRHGGTKKRKRLTRISSHKRT